MLVNKTFPAQYLQPPLPALMLPSCGLTVLPQLVQRHFHEVRTPLKGSNGSNPAARISSIAVSDGVVRFVADVVRPHFKHDPFPAFTECNRGLTVAPQGTCIDFQGISYPGYLV